jgi:rhamnose transport system permease protein
MNRPHGHGTSIAVATLLLAIALAYFAPGFFEPGNLLDLLMANVPVAIVAIGSLLVLLTGEIDVSPGSVFAVCSVLAGVLAKIGMPMPVAVIVTVVAGGCVGAINGVLVAYAAIPSIVVTLAAMVVWRDGLRWLTQGAWVQGLPEGFQWLGAAASGYPALVTALLAVIAVPIAWALRRLHLGRAVYATGSNAEAARLAGIRTRVIKAAVFAAAGALTATGAVLNAARFNQIPSNTGLGLELRVIAAVVVGGAAISGGRGSVTGTLLGVALLGVLSPALTFLGASPYWEQALQGLILLTAVAINTIPALVRRSSLGARKRHHAQA